jgi:hypothetical protein
MSSVTGKPGTPAPEMGSGSNWCRDDVEYRAKNWSFAAEVVIEAEAALIVVRRSELGGFKYVGADIGQRI